MVQQMPLILHNSAVPQPTLQSTYPSEPTETGERWLFVSGRRACWSHRQHISGYGEGIGVVTVLVSRSGEKWTPHFVNGSPLLNTMTTVCTYWYLRKHGNPAWLTFGVAGVCVTAVSFGITRYKCFAGGVHLLGSRLR